MSESLEGVIKIDDVELPAFKEMLRFFYAGVCDFGEAKRESEGKEGNDGKESKERKSGGPVGIARSCWLALTAFSCPS